MGKRSLLTIGPLPAYEIRGVSVDESNEGVSVDESNGYA